MSNEEEDDIPLHCFLDISIAGGPSQKVVIELFRDQVPVTCRNFTKLCASPDKTTRKQPVPTYRGCEFHRVAFKFMVQGGDFEKFNGSGGYSWNGGTFDDESFEVLHDQPGIVSMANRGKHTNGSQFFITLQATPHLNNKHVAFGRVVEGMNVVHEMTQVELENNDRPVALQRIVIVDCGIGHGESTQLQKDSDSSLSKEKKKNKKRKKRRKRDRYSSEDNDTDDSTASSDR